MLSQSVVEIQLFNCLQMILRCNYSVYNASDNSSNLQQSIDKLVNRSKLQQSLQIILNRCHALHIRANSNTFSRDTLNGSPHSNLTVASDLDVFVDSNLTLEQHIGICTVITIAQQCVGVLFEALFQDPQILFAKLLQLTFVLY